MRYGQYIEGLEAKRDVIRAERQTIEHRVSQLRPQSLDPDLLDERAREVLGFAHPNERVILLEPDAPPAPAK
jgi:cell division protein FtsB